MQIGRILDANVTVFILDSKAGKSEHGLLVQVEVFFKFHQSLLFDLLEEDLFVSFAGEPITKDSHYLMGPQFVVVGHVVVTGQRSAADVAQNFANVTNPWLH